MKVRALLRLMRFDKPVGTLLLWFPVAWALWISSHGHPQPFLVCYFFLGTVVMRAAGCVMNDLADRHIDKHVKRTQFRPITAGDIGFFEAILLLVALLLLAFWVLIHLPISCFFIAILALLTTLAYPFGKRFLQAPQLILSIAFSIAIPMVYVAQAHRLDAGFVWLFALNVTWVVAYDTMYAMADKADDLTIGIHSTAIFFGKFDRLAILLLQLFTHAAWLALAILYQFDILFYGCWLIGVGLIIYQQQLLRRNTPQACMQAFLNNAWYGAVMWLALAPINPVTCLEKIAAALS